MKKNHFHSNQVKANPIPGCQYVKSVQNDSIVKTLLTQVWRKVHALLGPIAQRVVLDQFVVEMGHMMREEDLLVKTNVNFAQLVCTVGNFKLLGCIFKNLWATDFYLCSSWYAAIHYDGFFLYIHFFFSAGNIVGNCSAGYFCLAGSDSYTPEQNSVNPDQSSCTTTPCAGPCPPGCMSCLDCYYIAFFH